MFQKPLGLIASSISAVSSILVGGCSGVYGQVPPSVYSNAIAAYNAAGTANVNRNFTLAEQECNKGLKLLAGYDIRLKTGILVLLTDVEVQQKNYTAAASAAKQGVALAEKIEGDQSPFYAKALISEAHAYDAHNQFSLCTPLLLKSTTILREALQKGDPRFRDDYIKSLRMLFYSYIGENKDSEALSTAAVLLPLTTRPQATDFDLHFALAGGASQIGDAYYSLGKDKEAQPFYEKSVRLYYQYNDKGPGPVGAMKLVLPTPNIIGAMDHLSQIYEKAGRLAEAEHLRSEAKTARQLSGRSY